LGDISLGADWRQSFQQHGLLREREVGLLKSAAQAGNLPWALRETAAGMERQCAHRVRAIFQLLTPIVVLTLGAVTSLIVIGLFIPLVSLIEHLL
jgi:protein transport protein HofC